MNAASPEPSSRPRTASAVPRTWAGRTARSIVGYALLRLLSALWLRWWSRKERPPYLLHDYAHSAGSFQFETTTHPDPAALRDAWQTTHEERLTFAATLQRNRLALHSDASAQHYQEIGQRLVQINRSFRRECAQLDTAWDQFEREHPGLLTRYEQREPPVGDAAGASFDVFAKLASEAWERTRWLLLDAARLEIEWQRLGYTELIEKIEGAAGRRSRSLRRVLARFGQAGHVYLAYEERRCNDERGTWEYRRKKAESRAFDALWRLHRVVERAWSGPNEGLVAPLTFLWKTQCWFLARRPVGMSGLEPMFERTLDCRRTLLRLLGKPERDKEIDTLAATGMGMNLLADYLHTVRVVTIEGVEHAFTPSQWPKVEPVEGFGPEVQLTRSYHQPGIAVSHWTHTGMLDYAGVLGVSFMLGLPPPAIVAEEAMRFVPVMGKYLQARGLLLSRSKDEARRRTFETRLSAYAEAGMMLSIFGTGTRALGWPLVSPFADLDQPGVLHLPGEFIPSRDMTGMFIKHALALQAPLLVFTMNLQRGGLPEPAVPRSLSGFFGNHTLFRFAQPGRDDGWVALAGRIPAALLRRDRRDDLWATLQQDVAVVRWMEMRTGYRMDAGVPSIEAERRSHQPTGNPTIT